MQAEWDRYHIARTTGFMWPHQGCQLKGTKSDRCGTQLSVQTGLCICMRRHYICCIYMATNWPRITTADVQRYLVFPTDWYQSQTRSCSTLLTGVRWERWERWGASSCVRAYLEYDTHVIQTYAGITSITSERPQTGRQPINGTMVVPRSCKGETCTITYRQHQQAQHAVLFVQAGTYHSRFGDKLNSNSK